MVKEAGHAKGVLGKREWRLGWPRDAELTPSHGEQGKYTRGVIYEGISEAAKQQGH